MSLETRKLEQRKDRQDRPSENIRMSSTLWHSMWMRFLPDLRQERAKPVLWRETFLRGSRGQLASYSVDSHPSNNPQQVSYISWSGCSSWGKTTLLLDQMSCAHQLNGTDMGSQRGKWARHLSVTWWWDTNQPGLSVQLLIPAFREEPQRPQSASSRTETQVPNHHGILYQEVITGWKKKKSLGNQNSLCDWMQKWLPPGRRESEV